MTTSPLIIRLSADVSRATSAFRLLNVEGTTTCLIFYKFALAFGNAEAIAWYAAKERLRQLGVK